MRYTIEILWPTLFDCSTFFCNAFAQGPSYQTRPGLVWCHKKFSKTQKTLTERSTVSVNPEKAVPPVRMGLWDQTNSQRKFMIPYHHKRAQVAHLFAEGTTSCGLKLTKDHVKVETSRFLDFCKCRRCAAAKPIKDAGALASAFKKQPAERKRLQATGPLSLATFTFCLSNEHAKFTISFHHRSFLI